MTSSGTTTFSMSNASVAVAAYSRLQIRRTALLAEHFLDAYNEFNLMQSSLSNLQPNLWTVDLVTVPLVAGTATYSVDPSTIMILDMYLNISTENTRLIFPVSRTDYASYTNKTSQGTPTTFWFDRLINPTFTLWEVPDGSITSLSYYRCVQIQDANFAGGETPNIPYRFLDVFVSDLSHRLARIWKPELEQARKVDADAAWSKAATQDVENVDLVIAPQLSSYYR